MFFKLRKDNNFRSKPLFHVYQGKSPPGEGCEKWEEVSSPKGRAEDMQRGAGEKTADSRGIPLHGMLAFSSQKEE